MKKILYGLSGLIILTFVIVLVASAQNNTRGTKKDVSEMSIDCSKCPGAAACEKKTEAKSCDVPECKELGCKTAKCKEGRSDPSTCKAACSVAAGDIKKCDQPLKRCCSVK